MRRKQKYQSVFLLSAIAAALQIGWAVQEPDVTLEFIQTSHHTSFPILMRVAVNNVTYTPLNLVDRMKSSQLVIDGKSAWRKEEPFGGPPGLPAMGHWEACLPVSDYASTISAGRHHMIFRMGNAQSKEVDVEWTLPVNWRAGNLKTRTKEIQDMADSLKKGLPRSCVEEWLTVEDGGVQEADQVRYFLEPFMKVLVPYDHVGGTGLDAEIIGGPVQVYQENHLKD